MASLPPLRPLLLVCVLLPAALCVDSEVKSSQSQESRHENANQGPVINRLTQNADTLRRIIEGSEHSGNSSENTRKTKRHPHEPSPSQSGLSCTAQCPLCPSCPPAQLCPSPCPAVPKCPDTQVCHSPCKACPACPSCKRPVPHGYEHFEGLGYYRLHNVPLNWFEAKETCEREGAHLAIINSEEEAKLMKNFFSRDFDMGSWLYLGFHDLYKEGRYVTLFGQPVSQTGYNTWNPGQPDNANNNENCGSMYPSGGLNDLTCSSKQPFVCEFIV